MTNLKLLELFGGIRACSKALERLGIEYECVDYVEIDKYAVASSNAIYHTTFQPQDIRSWNKNIEVDLIMHGSPCQDFSLAGNGFGGDEGSGTRSSLMYETIRIVEKLKPKYVIWENVKNLLSNKHKHNFNTYLDKMNKLGYNNYYQVLNAKNYGIPQNRERIFTVSIRKDLIRSFVFPQPFYLNLSLRNMLEDEVSEKFFLSDNMIRYICANNKKWTGNNNKSLINKSIASTINTGEGTRRCDASNYICNYLPENYDLKLFYKSILKGSVDEKFAKLKIRKLTPKECWRLMGFDDIDIDKASQVNSNTQLYKQAGNTIVVDVLVYILKNLLWEYI